MGTRAFINVTSVIEGYGKQTQKECSWLDTRRIRIGSYNTDRFVFDLDEFCEALRAQGIDIEYSIR